MSEEKDAAAPEVLTVEYIESIARRFVNEPYAKLLFDDSVFGQRRAIVYDRLDALVAKVERRDIFRSMTMQGYFEQRIPIHVNEADDVDGDDDDKARDDLRVRTITQHQQDEAMRWASGQVKDTESGEFMRALSYRRLCHGLVNIGDANIIPIPITSSYMTMDGVEALLTQSADQVHDRLSRMPAIFVDQLRELYSLWEMAVDAKMSATSLMGIAGNSMRSRPTS